MMIRILPWSIVVGTRSNSHQTENRDVLYRWMQPGTYPITKPLYMFRAWHQVVTLREKADVLPQVFVAARQQSLTKISLVLQAVRYDIVDGYLKLAHKLRKSSIVEVDWKIKILPEFDLHQDAHLPLTTKYIQWCCWSS